MSQRGALRGMTADVECDVDEKFEMPIGARVEV